MKISLDFKLEDLYEIYLNDNKIQDLFYLIPINDEFMIVKRRNSTYIEIMKISKKEENSFLLENIKKTSRMKAVKVN
jgi:hypothetical protein